MTDFMTTLRLILVQLTCPRHQRVNFRSFIFAEVEGSRTGAYPTKLGNRFQTAVRFQSICNRCRESHKTQVWLCFLVVSFLSMSAYAASGQNLSHFQQCVKVMIKQNENSLLKSDAMLYAPSIDDIKNNCETVSLKCYTEELTMVLGEEQIEHYIGCVFDFASALSSHLGGCPVCETYPLKNITVFLERLETLLEKMITQYNLEGKK